MADRTAELVVLFDFFGTLVTYEDDRTALRYDRTVELLASWGYGSAHEDFVAEWDSASTAVETASGDDRVETTMTEAALAFGARAGLDLGDGRCDQLVGVFLDEWAAPVRAVPGVAAMLAHLAGCHRLGVVSNTHDPSMVPLLLERFDMAASFEHVVLSVVHGRRKPHPSIYESALARFGVPAGAAVFVGDSYEPDYLGPIEAGMRAFIIDPERRHPVPADHRLDSVLDLEPALARLPPP